MKNCTNENQVWYDENKELFWLLASISIVLSLCGMIGNGFVIFAATQKGRIASSYRYLNRVVLTLAISDFCYSLLGEPCYITYWYWGKHITIIPLNIDLAVIY